MTKYVATGKARVYRPGQPGYLEMPLGQAKDFVRRTPGTELYGLMRKVDDASL